MADQIPDMNDFNYVKKEIKNLTDEQLDRIGHNTHILLAYLTKAEGKDSPNTVACREVFDMLASEWESRHPNENVKTENTPAPVPAKKVREKVPDTYYELMSLGDGSIVDPEIAKE